MSKIFVTDHAIERYVERTNKRFQHLAECKHKCEICAKLKVDRDQTIEMSKKHLIENITAQVQAGDEDRRVLNNTHYMSYCYEKYGYDRDFHFIINDHLVFLIIISKGIQRVVTVIGYQMYYNKCNWREEIDNPKERWEARELRKTKRQSKLPEFVQTARHNIDQRQIHHRRK